MPADPVQIAFPWGTGEDRNRFSVPCAAAIAPTVARSYRHSEEPACRSHSPKLPRHAAVARLRCSEQSKAASFPPSAMKQAEHGSSRKASSFGCSHPEPATAFFGMLRNRLGMRNGRQGLQNSKLGLSSSKGGSPIGMKRSLIFAVDWMRNARNAERHRSGSPRYSRISDRHHPLHRAAGGIGAARATNFGRPSKGNG
jgi:hypothetical protein